MKNAEVTVNNKEKMEEIYSSCKTLAEKRNEHYSFADFTAVKEADDKIDSNVKKYAELSEAECFAQLKAMDKPLVGAATVLTYTVIRPKVTKDKDTKMEHVEIVEAEKIIDILKLHKSTTTGIGEETRWPALIERFNMQLTGRGISQIGIDDKNFSEKYKMSEEASKVTGLKTGNKSKDSAILADLKMIVKAMLGETEAAKVSASDVNFLIQTFSKNGKGVMNVQYANHAALRANILRVCHHLVVGVQYGAEYKTK